MLPFFFRNPEVIDECELDEQTKRVLLSNIKRRLTPQAVKIRSGLLQVVHGHSTLHNISLDEDPSDSSYVSTSPLEMFPPLLRCSAGRTIDAVLVIPGHPNLPSRVKCGLM